MPIKPTIEDDATAILERFANGQPTDPAAVERLHAQVQKMTNDIRQTRGLIDDETFQSLLDDET